MITTRIPAGLKRGTEFFAVFTGTERRAECISNGKYSDFANAPKTAKQILYADMKSKPDVEAAMIGMVGHDEDAKLERFTLCQRGALNYDDNPDIDENGKLAAPEYVPCADRGTCKYEGRGCCSILIREGVFLSRAEVDVFKLVMYTAKEIGEKLFISPLTVKKHFQNIELKAGFSGQKEMIHWATQKGII